jgi:hypothetical protein
MQGKCNALIWDGAYPYDLNFISRTNPYCIKLRLYAQEGDIAPMIEYLEAEGYTWFKLLPAHVGPIKAMTAFRKTMADSGEKKVTISFDRNLPICCILDRQRTAQGLSFLSWNKAYHLYPYETFVKEEHHLVSTDERIQSYLVELNAQRKEDNNAPRWDRDTTSCTENFVIRS